MSNVSSASKYFPMAQEGFSTTTSGLVSAGATTVGLNGTGNYTNGDQGVWIIDLGVTNKEQSFTGTMDTSGSQITGVVWLSGTNVAHTSGATVVDYAAAGHIDLISTGILKQHTQAGAHTGITTDTITVSSGTTLPAGDIGTADLASNAVTTAKITNANVTADKLATGAQVATVATSQTTTSTSYTDLATSGPAVTATIGANGLALVILTGLLTNNTAGATAQMSFVVTVSSSVSAGSYEYIHTAAVNGYYHQGSGVWLLTGLTAGSNTFTCKYKVSSGTGTFQNRYITVIPL